MDLTPTLAKHQVNPLVQRRYYFLLPLDLLKEVVNAIGTAAFDDELLAMDFDLARAAVDTTIVGLRYGQTFAYPWLD